MQQSIPNVFGESDEAWMLSVLGEILHPSASTSYLSEQYVKEIEKRPGYLELLLKIVYNPTYSISIRQLAIICIKNCVTRRWWRHLCSESENKLSEDEKSHLVTVMMSNLAVPLDNPILITQFSLVIAHIARIEYPRRLSDLFRVIEMLLNSNDVMSKYQGICCMNRCLKSFATCRIGPVCGEFFGMIPNLLTLLPAVIASNVASLNVPLYADLLHMSLNTLYCVISRGVLVLRNPTITESLPSIAINLFPVATACLQHPDFHNNNQIQKCVKWSLKIILCITESNWENSQSFVITLAGMSNQLLFSFWSSSVDDQQLIDMWPILSLVLKSIKLLLQKSSTTQALRELYSDDCIQQLLRCLHLAMFPFTNTQQQHFVENGEAFHWSQVNSVIRETIGFLFEEITGNFTTLVTNYLVSFYQNTTSLSMTEICGYLCMIETAYISLHKNLSFSDIWGYVLKPCIINGLNDSSFHLPVYECLRVIRAWHRLISSEELIEVNSLLLMCLKCGSIGIQLQAVECINTIVSSHTWKQNHIEAHYSDILSNLFQLYENCSLQETKQYLISVFTSLVTNCKASINYISEILHGFECLWTESVKMGDTMSQLSLLRLLVNLVKMAKDTMKPFVPSLLRIIQYELTESGDEGLELFLEDGLILWVELLHLSNLTYTSEMHRMFNIIFQHYSREMKLFVLIMELTDGYVCLGKQTFLQDYHNALSSMFHSFLSFVDSRELRRVASSLHLLLLLFPEEGLEVIAESMDQIVGTVIASESDQSPSKLSESDMVSYLMIIGQLLLNGSSALTCLALSCQRLDIEDEVFFTSMLSAFLHSFDTAGGGSIGFIRRAMFVQCLFFCLIHGPQSNLSRLEEILDCVMDVVTEEEMGEEKLRRLFSERSMVGSLSPEYVKKYLCQSNVRQSCGVFVQELVAKWGENCIRSVLNTMDPEVVTPLREYISLFIVCLMRMTINKLRTTIINILN